MMQVIGAIHMTEREFCYWLKGFFEILSAGPKTAEKLSLTAEQTEMIEKHLRSVFSETIMLPQVAIQTTPFQFPTPQLPFQPQNPGGAGQPIPTPPYTVTCQGGSQAQGGQAITGGHNPGPSGIMIC